MSLYSKDDCRKISYPVNPICWRALWSLSLGEIIHRASCPASYLHPHYVMFIYSGKRKEAAGPPERADVAHHKQKKPNWNLCYWATAFFHGFSGRSIYNTHPPSLKAARTLSKGQLLPGVELWGDKRLRLVKFP